MAVPAMWGLWLCWTKSQKVPAIPRLQMISRGAQWLIGRASDSGARGVPAIPRVQMIRRGARWLSGRASDSGARGRRGGRNLPLPCCVLDQDTLLPESTGNTGSGAPAQHIDTTTQTA